MIRFKSNRGRTARRKNPTKHFMEQYNKRKHKALDRKKLEEAIDFLDADNHRFFASGERKPTRPSSEKPRLRGLPSGEYAFQISGPVGEPGDYIIGAVLNENMDALLTYRAPDETPNGTRRDTAIIPYGNVARDKALKKAWAPDAPNALLATPREQMVKLEVHSAIARSRDGLSENELFQRFGGQFTLGEIRVAMRGLYHLGHIAPAITLDQVSKKPRFSLPQADGGRTRRNPSVEALRKEYARYRRDTIKEWEYKRIVDPSQSQEKLNALFDDTVKETLVHAHLKGTPEDYVEAARGLFNHFRFYTGD